MKEKLLGKSLDELRKAVSDIGLPKFVAQQICDWLYKKKVYSFEQMCNISKENRSLLKNTYEIGHCHPIDCQISVDGTKKYLFPVECTIGGKSHKSGIEAVMIPDKDRKTLCVSSQAGCKMGCKFCMTARQGFKGNLSCSDILSQLLTIEEKKDIDSIVFMGMGEPLDNYENVIKAIEVITSEWGLAWSPKRITLSSIGLIPNLNRYLKESKCHLAISLHFPYAEQRAEFMPAQKLYQINDVIKLISNYNFSQQRRISFEYIMFKGLNDDKASADKLINMIRGINCRVNLIRFHKIPDFPYESSSDIVMELFKNRLNSANIIATIRSSRGEDILAACGMLAGKNKAMI